MKLISLYSTAPGDSGAWVFDRPTGRVCGHVLAWSAKSNTTYISPMEVTFDDIARTLRASVVSLPGDPSRSMGYVDPNSPQAAQYRYQAQRLPGDFGRLTFGAGGSPGPPVPPYPHHYPHPQAHHPAYGRPPPPPPPPPGSREAHGPVYSGPVPPIPPSLLAGPCNIERQLA